MSGLALGLLLATDIYMLSLTLTVWDVVVLVAVVVDVAVVAVRTVIHASAHDSGGNTNVGGIGS